MSPPTYAAWLSAALASRRISRAELARQLSIPASRVSAYCSGARRPGRVRAEQIGAALGCGRQESETYLALVGGGS